MIPSARLCIVHRLPGRIRLRLDNLTPDWSRMEKDLRGHEGIGDFRPINRLCSAVITYDPSVIEEAELVLRIALSISISSERSSVVLEREIVSGNIESEAMIVLAALFLIGAVRLLPAMKRRKFFLDILAGLLSGGSILAHAVEELHNDGTFHPETLSVVYLATAILKGQGYSGALLSWLASYGRHFRGHFLEELIINVEKLEAGKKGYNLNLEAGSIRPVGKALRGYIPAMFAHALAGGKPGEAKFLSDFRDVSDRHGNMLEGLKGLTDGITMNIR